MLITNTSYTYKYNGAIIVLVQSIKISWGFTRVCKSVCENVCTLFVGIYLVIEWQLKQRLKWQD